MTLLRTEHVDSQREDTRHSMSTYMEYLPQMELHLKFVIKLYTHFGIACSINLGILLSQYVPVLGTM
jgi:hypothetical protein